MDREGFEPPLPFREAGLQPADLPVSLSVQTAGTAGVEPTTYWLTANCSPIELCSQSVGLDLNQREALSFSLLQRDSFDHSDTYANQCEGSELNR
jgi:hypothetical protein